jgi:hypothetical protein
MGGVGVKTKVVKITARGKEKIYRLLNARHFTTRECRMLSSLGRLTPALRAVIADRERRRNRFERYAASMVSDGRWTRADVVRKWLAYIGRVYTQNHWRVAQGTIGSQEYMARGSMNPWACYRAFEKEHPSRRDVSPWETRKPKGKTKLAKGIVFVQQLEKGTRTATQTQLRQWIGQKEEAVRKSHDKQRKTQLRLEIRRLEGLLQ